MSRFRSRKFLLALGTVISIALVEFTGFEVSPEAIAAIVVVVTGYIFGQGMIDKSVAAANVIVAMDVSKTQLQAYVRQLEKQLKDLTDAVLTVDVGDEQSDVEGGYR